MKQYGMSVILCVFMILIVGCSGTTPETKAPSANEEQASSPELDAKLAAFGKTFETSFKADLGTAIDRYIDTQEVLRSIKSNPVYRNLSMKDSNYLGQKLTNTAYKDELKKEFATIAAGITLTYSGIVRQGQKSSVVFRLENEDEDIDYWVITCAVSAEGEVTPDSLYIATVGGNYNDYLARTLLDHFLASPGFVSRLTGKTNNELKKKLEIVGRMGKAMKAGNFDQAISIYETEGSDKYKYLPLDLLYLRVLRAHDANITDAQLKSETDKAENAVKTIKSYKPDFIGGELFLVERYIAMQDVDKGKATLLQLRSKVGEDAYLDYFEGLLYLRSNPNNAMSLFKSAGRKGLRSRAYLVAYYSLMKKTPGTSEAAMDKILETGTSLYGPTFKQMAVKNATSGK
ncbi:MAG: hypothetical protein Q4G59_03240 [Planctomycetia bacterium]|nr:hypothetical protein [Planctomycetia bacterium]